jgi:FtsP/CotA-like multicopper oxidase with cupredoxin domain
MRRLLSLLCLFALAGPAPAQEWRMAPEYDVLLTSYDIVPETIRLQAGTPVRLRFVNNSNQRLSFFARSLFRNARLRGRDAELVADGVLEVGPLSTETIALVPKAGRYKVRSANFLHRLLGMTGTVVVE